VFLLCSTPFLTSGMALAVAFRVTTSPNGVYFVDLLGAGFGCALAVGAIWIFGSPGTVALSAVAFVGAAVMAAPPSRRGAYGAAGAVMIAAAVAVAVFVPLRPSPEKLLAKTLDEEKAADEKLSALAEGGINQEAADAAQPDDENGDEDEDEDVDARRPAPVAGRAKKAPAMKIAKARARR
jgi:hypothetical protein